VVRFAPNRTHLPLVVSKITNFIDHKLHSLSPVYRVSRFRAKLKMTSFDHFVLSLDPSTTNGTGGTRENGENLISLLSPRTPVQYFDFVIDCFALIDKVSDSDLETCRISISVPAPDHFAVEIE